MRFVGCVLALLAVAASPALAQRDEGERIQVQPLVGEARPDPAGSGSVLALDGSIRRDANVFYLLSGLREGQTLSVHVRATSGNLDPFVALVDGRLDDATLDQRLAELQDAVTDRRDLLTVLPDFANDLFLAWNDDGGKGYAATFEWAVQADGDYQLLVVARPESGTFGDFRLLIGLDAPDVRSGEAEPRGMMSVAKDVAASRPERAVQEIAGTIATGGAEAVIPLEDVRAYDELTVFVEATSGDLVPRIILEDFGGKPIEGGTVDRAGRQAKLRYEFPESGSNFRLRVHGDRATSGKYRLLIGLNAPEVMEGHAIPVGRELVARPTKVMIGIRLDQITEVDQKSENFGVVADLRMIWRDRRLAFSPDSCACASRLMPITDFFRYAQERNTRWPENTLPNQQGRRWAQAEVVEIFSDGRAIYSERFSATLQAPDFDFRKYPFDQQKFFIRFQSFFPETDFVYLDLPGYSGLGEQLGEEEWLTTRFETLIDNANGRARFSYMFEAERHIVYYVVRIFLPLLLIILVSWFVFFLRDYTKRIDLAGANLLLFIAFNFTISGDLPRLGYLTLMDTILVCTFMITGLVLAFSVYLRWLEVNERLASAQALDRHTLWIYPTGYLAAFGAVGWLYLG